MMDPATMNLGLGLASGASSWFTKRLEADLLRKQTDEQVRRLKLSQAQQLGGATLAGAASGIELNSGSLQAHLGAMSAEMERQVVWARSAGYAGAAATETAGNFGLVTDFGGALFQYGASNNWFQEPALTPAGKR